MAKKGYKVTSSVLERLTKARAKIKNRKHSDETKNKIRMANKNNPLLMKPMSEKTKEKLRIIALETGFGKNNKGKKMSVRTREIMSNNRKGEKHWNWQGGKTPEALTIRHSTEYILWRIAVFMRDDYICQSCGKRGGKLNADHIKPFALYPELRFAIDNGRTLCVNCHKTTETYGVNATKYLKKRNLL